MSMETNGVKRLPVMRGDKLVGIVSRANLLQAVASLAREIPDPTADDDHIRSRIIAAIENERLVPVRPQCHRARRHRPSQRRHHRRAFTAGGHRGRGERRRRDEGSRPSVLGRHHVRDVSESPGRRSRWQRPAKPATADASGARSSLIRARLGQRAHDVLARDDPGQPLSGSPAPERSSSGGPPSAAAPGSVLCRIDIDEFRRHHVRHRPRQQIVIGRDHAAGVERKALQEVELADDADDVRRPSRPDRQLKSSASNILCSSRMVVSRVTVFTCARHVLPRRSLREIDARGDPRPVFGNALNGTGTRNGAILVAEVPRHAAEHPFAESRVAIGARDHDAGADIGGDILELSAASRPPFFGNQCRGPRYRGRAARPPRRATCESAAGAAAVLLRDFRDRDFLGRAASATHRIARRASRRPSRPPECFADRAITRCRRHHEQRPAGLHHQIARVRRRAGIRPRLGCARRSRGCRRLAPAAAGIGTGKVRAERHSTDVGALLDRSAKLRFEFRQCRSSARPGPGRSEFCACSPSAKYIGGLSSEAAMPMIRAPNRSAISPATRGRPRWAGPAPDRP